MRFTFPVFLLKVAPLLYWFMDRKATKRVEHIEHDFVRWTNVMICYESDLLLIACFGVDHPPIGGYEVTLHIYRMWWSI